MSETLKKNPSVEWIKYADPRDVDAIIADKVIELPQVGWYKRESKYGMDSVACNKGDCTSDMTEWKARLEYLPYMSRGAVVENAMIPIAPMMVPQYSTRPDEALKVLDHLQDRLWSLAMIAYREYHCIIGGLGVVAGTMPHAVCLAALRSQGVELPLEQEGGEGR